MNLLTDHSGVSSMDELFPTRCTVSPNEVEAKGCGQTTVIRATYIWVLFFEQIPFAVNHTFKRNASGEVATLAV